MDNFRSYVESVDDANDFRTAKVSYLGDQLATIELITPWGFDHSPPEGCWALTFPVNNSNENLTGVADNPLTRFKFGVPGEVVVWNPTTKSKVKFNVDGSISIDSLATTNITSVGPVNVTSPTVTVNGNVNIIGNVNVSGTLSIAGIGFATHVHGGVQSGGNTTGVPS